MDPRLGPELRAPGSKLVLMHKNADPDAIGSAAALSRAFGGDVGAVESVSLVGRRVAGILGLSILIDPDPQRYDRVFIVDTSSPTQLGPLAPLLRGPVLIDHHEYFEWPGARIVHVEKDCTSCCEVVHRVLGRLGVVPDATAATGLLLGLVADSARFRYATPATLRAAAELVELSGRGIESVLEALEPDEPRGGPARCLAHLKAAARVVVHDVAGWIVATSSVASFEASAAKALIVLGADVALVVADRGKDGIRLSGRADRRPVEAGLNLGRLMNGLARKLGEGGGGGHAGAAGYNGRADPEKVTGLAIELLGAMLPRNERREPTRGKSA